MPLTLTGTELNRKPSVGRAPRFVRCSQIGIPAASRVEWTGRSRLAVSSMLSESIPTRTAPWWRRWRAAGSVRNG
jgi:hypothetical protein